METRKVLVPQLNRHAHFTDRHAMKAGHPHRRYKLFNGETRAALPPATLPIDWTKNNTLSFPYDDNDTLGDCEYAAAEHADNTFTGNVGTQSVFDDTATRAAYLRLSGGDNGLDNGMIIGEWENRGLANIPQAKILDALDIDPTNAPMVQSAMQMFGGVLFQLAVPTAWINNFKTGYTWDAGPGIVAVPANGHAILWNGCQANGVYKLQTWGTYGYITPAGVKACDPTAFVVFSLRWFNAQGVAPNGLTYDQLAAYWVQAGGKALPPNPFTNGPTPVNPPSAQTWTLPQIQAANAAIYADLEHANPYMAGFIARVGKAASAELPNALAASGKRLAVSDWIAEAIALGRQAGLSMIEALQLIEQYGPQAVQIIQHLLALLPKAA